MKVLVTGASGFIGKHLFNKLIDLNYNVLGVSYSGCEIGGHKIVHADVTNRKSLEGVFKNNHFEIVFHLAAAIPKNPKDSEIKEYLSVNIEGVYNLLELCRKYSIKKVVYSSSESVYNRKMTVLPANEKDSGPENIYGISKLAGENLCEMFQRSCGLKTVSLRYSSVFGEGQGLSSILPIFLNKALKNEDMAVFGTGERTQDFIYVKDVVEADIKAAFSKAEGIYNIGSGKEISVIALAKTIKKIFFESRSGIVHKRIESEDKSRFVLDITKAKKELGFSPEYTLETGLKDLKMIYENRFNR